MSLPSTRTLRIALVVLVVTISMAGSSSAFAAPASSSTTVLQPPYSGATTQNQAVCYYQTATDQCSVSSTADAPTATVSATDAQPYVVASDGTRHGFYSITTVGGQAAIQGRRITSVTVAFHVHLPARSLSWTFSCVPDGCGPNPATGAYEALAGAWMFLYASDAQCGTCTVGDNENWMFQTFQGQTTCSTCPATDIIVPITITNPGGTVPAGTLQFGLEVEAAGWESPPPGGTITGTGINVTTGATLSSVSVTTNT